MTESEDRQEISWKLFVLLRNLKIFEAGFETRTVVYNPSFLCVLVVVTGMTDITIQPSWLAKPA